MKRFLILLDTDTNEELDRRNITNSNAQEISRLEDDMRQLCGEGNFRVVDTGAEG